MECTAKTQRRTNVWRGKYGFLHCLEPGYRKTQHRTYVWRQFYGFVGSFDTGLPEITVSVGAPNRY